jgi:hypothetical protein
LASQKQTDMTQDDEQLRLLSLFHYIVAGLAGLFSLFPIIHLVMGLFLVFGSESFFKDNHGQPPPTFIGWFFVIIASFFIICGLTFASLVLTAGRFLAKRRHYTFCFVMAGIECIFMPFGTVLGVFTIIVLSRESVKKLFLAQ